MSTALYQMLALAARYLFALLGLLIVLRTFWGVIADHGRRKARVRSLPFSDTVGELVTVSGSRELPDGQSVAVPWEGVLGSVRSCDVYLPGSGVFRNHLSFSFQPGQGLVLKLFSGREARVNDMPVDCRSSEEALTLHHGDYLQVGELLLRLRLYAALDPTAGFDPRSQGAACFPAAPEEPGFVPAFFPAIPPETQPSPESYPAAGIMSGVPGQPGPESFPAPGVLSGVPGQPGPESFPAAGIMSGVPGQPGPEESDPALKAPDPAAETAEDPPESTAGSPSLSRRRRRNGWEADWSE